MAKPKPKVKANKKKAPPDRYQYDYTLLLVTAILVVIGTVMVFSSSVIMAEARWDAPYVFFVRHAVWAVLGVLAMMLFARLDYRLLQKYSKPLYVATFLLLVAVLVIGTAKGGARRWLVLGPVRFQPSELAKLALVVGLADYLDRKKSRLKNMRGLWPALAGMGLLCAAIAFEPDLGTPVLMTAVGLSMLYVAGAKLRTILSLCALAVPVVAVEILRKPYRLARVRDFIGSWWDISSSSYQLNQSLLAMGSGGFLGKGLARSQMKLLYLPEPHTDFIFPIVGEELGYLGALLLIVAFATLGWRGWRISRKSDDYFGALLALGITWTMLYQTVINMGVSCGIFPTKGMPLPFVSYGGTSLLFNMVGIGILLSISKKKMRR